MEKIKKLKKLERELLRCYDKFCFYKIYAVYDDGTTKFTHNETYTREQNRDNCRHCDAYEICKNKFDANCKVVNGYKIT